MYRRRYLAGMGTGIGALVAGAGTGTGTAFERIRPNERISVAVGTTLMFEVEGSNTVWQVDGAEEGWSMGPWYAEYNGEFGHDYWQRTFESAGTYDVTALGDDGESTDWTVEATEDGIPAPSIDDARPDPGTIDATDGDSFDLEIDVTDPNDELDRVVWWLGQADRIVGESSVSGGADTASVTVDGVCHTCGIYAWTINEYGAVDSTRLWEFDTVGDDGALDVAITGTNGPVTGGEHLEVTAAVGNAGLGSASGTVALDVGGETVDTQSVSIGSGGSEAVTLGYDTYPVRRTVEFPVRVETDDDSDERTVQVFGAEDDAAGDGRFDVTVTGANDPVTGGERLEATVAVTNSGSATGSETVELVVGGDVVDARTVSLAPNSSKSVRLGYDTYPVRRDVTFRIAARTDDDTDSRAVTVYGTG